MEAKIVLGALKKVGEWVLKNPNAALDALDKVVKIPVGKKADNTEEQIQIIEAKINQLGAATLELDEKTTSQVDQLRKEIHTMKKIITVMGFMLGAVIIAVVLLSVI